MGDSHEVSKYFLKMDIGLPTYDLYQVDVFCEGTYYHVFPIDWKYQGHAGNNGYLLQFVKC